MTSMTRRLIATAALLGSLAATATPSLAQNAVSYPRAIGSGENVEIEYGPATGNVVGGGPVQLRQNGEETTITYGTTSAAQRSSGLPVVRGSGENAGVVYLPAGGTQRG